MTDPTPTLGERVAFHRKRHGLSQVELGRLIGRSESWVSQVERNTRKVDRLSVLTQVADVLNVSVSDLAPDAPIEATAVEHEPWREALRLALTGHPALSALFEPLPLDDGVEGEELADRVEQAWSLVHASRYSEAGPLLVELIVALESAVRSVPADRRPVLAGALARAYQAVGALFGKVDDVEAAWLASDRALFAAELAANPALVAAGQHRLALALLGAGRLQQSRHAASSGTATLRPHLASSGVELASALGALYLVEAIGAARAGDRSAAWRAIEEADRLASTVGAGRNDFNTEFGPSNVALHGVAVAVELGDAGDALDRAGRVDPSGLSPERRARFLVDVARAHAQRRARGEEVAALLEAEEIAPEQIHDHGTVRMLIRDLLQDPNRRSDQQLRALADRCGVPIQ
ncbi:helix-turn-helix transcriptional regulator [Frankia sp. Cas4]|uniref:helix-turn-helix transcriptional regulator n=1 Tax=Frankia sp. Cas4 TaxID=3073927 RepID=UPI002AD357E7|nr:helix-turn-helix transcriptional regulator [Frankia sp. Cas4]